MSSDEETFEQTAHVSDGFGGRHYRMSRRGFSSQSTEQAQAGRMGPMAMLQFGRDLDEVATNGSDQAKRRLKMFQLFFVVMFIIVPLTLFALGVILGDA